MSLNLDQSNPEIQELLDLIRGLLERLDVGAHVSETLGFLQNESFYFDVFCQMFDPGMFTGEEVRREFSKLTVGGRIQLLIDFLAEHVLEIDLEHINGFEIQNGNILHIKNFLQLILALIDSAEGEEEGRGPLASSERRSASFGVEEPITAPLGKPVSKVRRTEAAGPAERLRPEARAPIFDKPDKDAEISNREHAKILTVKAPKTKHEGFGDRANSRPSHAKAGEVAAKIFEDLERMDITKSKGVTPKASVDPRPGVLKNSTELSPRTVEVMAPAEIPQPVFSKKIKAKNTKLDPPAASNLKKKLSKPYRSQSARLTAKAKSKQLKVTNKKEHSAQAQALIETNNSRLVLKDPTIVDQRALLTLLARSNRKYQDCLNDFAYTTLRHKSSKDINQQQLTQVALLATHSERVERLKAMKFNELIALEHQKHAFHLDAQKRVANDQLFGNKSG